LAAMRIYLSSKNTLTPMNLRLRNVIRFTTQSTQEVETKS